MPRRKEDEPLSFRNAVAALAIAFSLISTQAPAQQSASGGPGGGGVLGLLPADAVTEHVLNAGGQAIPYEATAGTLNLFGQDGNRTGAIFYTAYVAKNRGSDRPVTFAFNGGPGASSAYLNLGLVGPRVLDFGPNGDDGAKAKLIDNPDSWLQFTDLVLIDPIGTGWSRTVKPDDASDFYGVRADAESLAKVIALYVAHNGRASSSKYLLGESYGGLRSAKVASALREQQGILVSGILMVSPLLDGQFVYGGSGSALGAAMQLPSLAAAALERRNAFNEAALADAEKFATGEYLTTLAGKPPTGDVGKAFYERVARLTGIPDNVVARSNGLLQDVYVKRSIDDGSDVVSSYDASFVAPDPYPESYADRGDDPILDGFTRAYGSAFSSYARDELGFHTEMTYTLLSGAVNGHWDWSGGRGGGSRFEASATDDIRQLLSLIPSFHILVAQGYSDLVIPYGINKYIIEHLPPEASGRVDLKLYRGGHMFYTRAPSRAQFSLDAKAFFEAASRSE
jgi:carboxypeptidase C (cathepsin A)